mmetsp:Transcript_24964/g.85448  ORF Transcript_24964/g.85448 Transcript_24964/m.85448 type:complete len:102 (-) Transcript_24964:417-722(-)
MFCELPEANSSSLKFEVVVLLKAWRTLAKILAYPLQFRLRKQILICYTRLESHSDKNKNPVQDECRSPSECGDMYAPSGLLNGTELTHEVAHTLCRLVHMS